MPAGGRAARLALRDLLSDVVAVQARRGDDAPLEERFRRQGSAYRRARLLYAAGFEIMAVQFSLDEPPQPLGVYRFDGIRFVRIPRHW
ncbi:MAG TPA: hypothetical protein VKX16_06360 [Chloroflexota bacterium]|nr:hypothetical protein [Chloroflexota bacterium]